MGRIAEPAAKKGRKPTPTPTPTTKKKGRPSRAESDARPPGSDPRRSLRQLRRSRRLHYSEYYDDFYDFEDEDEEEEERRREKKLKLVLKVSPQPAPAAHSSDGENRDRRGTPLKKRKVEGAEDEDDDVDVDDDECVRSIASGDEKQRGNDGRAREEAAGDSAACSPSGSPSAIPLPEPKLLELILDKLQKKDTYGVYSEPVDPEELPDYHEVIQHPMDFATVRKKLATGAYSTLEQFESDVYLICTNAMQYNAPDTIYFKQARAIQELAKKRFEKLRIDEPKSAQKTRLASVIEKSAKKSLSKAIQEHVSSDCSPVDTVIPPGETCSLSNTTLAGGIEKPVHVDGVSSDKNSSLAENKMDKAEELPAKVFQPKFVRKPLDENRRATYSVSNQPVAKPESLYSTFESEVKQMVAVGLHADHSYARSLARFAAVLGPTAWRVASKRIEQALPVGYKYGRGWVGEYEPLPTPVLTFEYNSEKQLPHTNSRSCRTESNRDGIVEKSKAAKQKFSPGIVQLSSASGMNSSGEVAASKTINSIKEGTLRGPVFEGKPGLFGALAACQQQKTAVGVGTAMAEANASKYVEISSSSSASGAAIEVVSRRPEQCAEVTSSRLLEMVSRNRNFAGSPFKQSEGNLHTNHHASLIGSGAMVLPTGDTTSDSDTSRITRFSPASASIHQGGLPNLFSAASQQVVDDPVKLMRMLSAKMTQGSAVQKPMNSPTVVDSQIMSHVPFSKRDDSSASAAAARAWMSIGPATTYNPVREPPSVMCMKSDNIFASQGISLASDVAHREQTFQNSKPVVFPQHMDPNLRFHVQPSWQGVHANGQQKPKKDMLPPDLNIGFQSPGSPAQQSSGIRVDPQQPDLALQL